jgi:hypothetical protein
VPAWHDWHRGAHDITTPHRGWQRRMNIRVTSLLTVAEQDELASWITTHECDAIDHVEINSGAVAIHGQASAQVMSAMAIRYNGRLVGALNEALSSLHNTP